MRPSRKLRNLNVWQQGIQQHRAAQRRGGASGGGGAHGGWARAFFRRLLGRRAAAAREATPTVQRPMAAAEQAAQAVFSQGRARPELREGMLSRRAITMPGQTSSPPRIARADAINVALCRDLRFWQRGQEFVAAARDGFDTGAGPEHVLERRAFWRQRSLRRSAAVGHGSASKAAQSLRLLLRGLAARQARDDVGPLGTGAAAPGPAPAGTVNIGGRSRKAANKKAPQPIAAAAGPRRTKSFRDHQFRQQGLNLLEKALRAKKQP